MLDTLTDGIMKLQVKLTYSKIGRAISNNKLKTAGVVAGVAALYSIFTGDAQAQEAVQYIADVAQEGTIADGVQNASISGLEDKANLTNELTQLDLRETLIEDSANSIGPVDPTESLTEMSKELRELLGYDSDISNLAEDAKGFYEFARLNPEILLNADVIRVGQDHSDLIRDVVAGDELVKIAERREEIYSQLEALETALETTNETQQLESVSESFIVARRMPQAVTLEELGIYLEPVNKVLGSKTIGAITDSMSTIAANGLETIIDITSESPVESAIAAGVVGTGSTFYTAREAAKKEKVWKALEGYDITGNVLNVEATEFAKGLNITRKLALKVLDDYNASRGVNEPDLRFKYNQDAIDMLDDAKSIGRIALAYVRSLENLDNIHGVAIETTMATANNLQTFYDAITGHEKIAGSAKNAAKYRALIKDLVKETVYDHGINPISIRAARDEDGPSEESLSTILRKRNKQGSGIKETPVAHFLEPETEYQPALARMAVGIAGLAGGITVAWKAAYNVLSIFNN